MCSRAAAAAYHGRGMGMPPGRTPRWPPPGSAMDYPNQEWQRKGATLSDKTARQEFGLTQDEIYDAIDAGTLQYRQAAMHGYPWLRLLRREVEALARTRHGDRYVNERQVKAFCDVISCCQLAPKSYSYPIVTPGRQASRIRMSSSSAASSSVKNGSLYARRPTRNACRWSPSQPNRSWITWCRSPRVAMMGSRTLRQIAGFACFTVTLS